MAASFTPSPAPRLITLLYPQEKGSLTCIKETNQRGSISLDCYANGVSFQGKKAPKFIIPIFELIAA
jgi:hypothetical protein